MGSVKDCIVPTTISRSNTENFSKFIIWKNFLLICFSMCFFYCAINGIGSIQSTINKEGGLGLASSTVVYTVFGLSGLMVPQLLMNTIKFKWTLFLGYSLQLLYIGLNAYPQWYTYIPASALGGFGQALAFTCAGTGISEICQIYGAVTNTNPNDSQGLFFGIFGIFIQTACVAGSLFIALIFRQDSTEGDFSFNNVTSNFTFNYTTCGKEFGPYSELPPSTSPDKFKLYILVGVFGFCALISIILSLFLNDIDYIRKEEGTSISNIIKHQVNELKKQFLQIDQFLAMWINLMNAFFLTFIWADFTRSFAGCAGGLDYIGWSNMALFGAATIFSPIFGKIANKFTIIPVFLIYYALTIGTSIYMLFWQSDPQSVYHIFILAGLLGTIESINTPQPRALYGIIFKTEVIYSSFTFFQGVGFLFGFLMTTFFSTYIKIYILLGFCGVCFLCGLILFIKKRKERQYQKASTNDDIDLPYKR